MSANRDEQPVDDPTAAPVPSFHLFDTFRITPVSLFYRDPVSLRPPQTRLDLLELLERVGDLLLSRHKHVARHF